MRLDILAVENSFDSLVRNTLLLEDAEVKTNAQKTLVSYLYDMSTDVLARRIKMFSCDWGYSMTHEEPYYTRSILLKSEKIFIKTNSLHARGCI